MQLQRTNCMNYYMFLSKHDTIFSYLKKAAKICKEKYDSDIPDTVEGLMKLPGVGPKMVVILCILI